MGHTAAARVACTRDGEFIARGLHFLPITAEMQCHAILRQSKHSHSNLSSYKHCMLPLHLLLAVLFAHTTLTEFDWKLRGTPASLY